MDILDRISPNAEAELPLSVRFIDKLKFFEKEKGKWYIKSLDSDGREKLVFNEESGKKSTRRSCTFRSLSDLISGKVLQNSYNN